VRLQPQWILRRRTPEAFLHQHPELDPVVARILYARHIETPAMIHAFLFGDGELEDPWHLRDMDHAVARIWKAIRSGEHIAVYGDFDVDGVTATVLMTSVLRELGAQVRPYIPDRFEDGYGLNARALDDLATAGVTLCVTVDCGVSSAYEVAHARAAGLDVVVTDHHTVPNTVPEAVAVVNPRRMYSEYAFRELAGVGVAYQVARALVADGPGASRAGQVLEECLDLVALGTIADVVPLEGENRTLARWGLERLRSAPRLGLGRLAEVAGLSLAGLDSADVAFRLAPRLNAAGRIEHARLAYALLTAGDDEQALSYAVELSRINQERQRLLEEQLEEACTAIDEAALPRLLFVQGPEYHEGVMGLVASRLREKYYRPALVLRRGPETSRGSARSVEGFHITRALEHCRGILARFGGHAQAAGLTVETRLIGELQKQLLEYAEQNLDDATLTPHLLVDAIVGLADIAFAPGQGRNTPQAIAALGPFGKGNPEPLLASLGVSVMQARAIGHGEQHLRLDIVQNGTRQSCIAFRQGELASGLHDGDCIDVVYRPQVHRWQDRESLQLVVEAVRTHQADGERALR